VRGEGGMSRFVPLAEPFAILALLAALRLAPC
jgi:hypothetical protein